MYSWNMNGTLNRYDILFWYQGTKRSVLLTEVINYHVWRLKDKLTFRHLQQRNILIFRGYSHFYQSGYTSLPLVIRSIIYHNHLIFQRTLGRVVCYVILSIFVYYYNIQYVVIIYSRLYIFTILPSIVDDPVTVDLKMMRDEWNSTLFQKLFPF